jgi:hypothetical protein
MTIAPLLLLVSDQMGILKITYSLFPLLKNVRGLIIYKHSLSIYCEN